MPDFLVASDFIPLLKRPGAASWARRPPTPLPRLWDDLSLRPYLGEIRRRHGIVEILALPSMRDLPPVLATSRMVGYEDGPVDREKAALRLDLPKGFSEKFGDLHLSRYGDEIEAETKTDEPAWALRRYLMCYGTRSAGKDG